MLDRLHGEINVEIGPTQMVWTRKLDVRDLTNCRLTKPRKFPERDEQLPFADEQPKTMRLDVGDFHRGTECDRRTHRSSLIRYGPRQCRESETGGNERCHKLRKALLKQDCGSENLS